MEKVLDSKKSMKKCPVVEKWLHVRKAVFNLAVKSWIYSFNKGFLWINIVWKHMCSFPDCKVKSFERKMSDAIKIVILKYISCYQLSLSAARKEWESSLESSSSRRRLHIPQMNIHPSLVAHEILFPTCSPWRLKMQIGGELTQKGNHIVKLLEKGVGQWSWVRWS